MKICSVDDCEKPVKAKGYCKKHHLQYWRTGDATLRQRRPSELLDDNFEIIESGCWNWTGYVDPNGYGKAYDPSRPAGRRLDWAHRVSYRNHKGPIPTRHEIDHVCQNTLCVNPDHLDAVTKAEHVRRTFERLGYEGLQRRAAYLRHIGLTYREIADVLGMSGRETAHQHVKAAIRKGLVDADDVPRVRHLSAADRDDIRMLHAFGIPQSELSLFFEVDSSQISRIINNRPSHKRAAS